MMDSQLFEIGSSPYSSAEVIPPRGMRRRAAAPVAAYCVWVNGELIPYEEEAHHFLNLPDRVPLAFEEIRCYQTERGPAIFRLRDHLRRFVQSAQEAGIEEMRYTIQNLQQAANVAVHANNFGNCTIRPVLYSPSFSEEYMVAVVSWERPHETRQRGRARGTRALISTTDTASSLGYKRYASEILAQQAAWRGGFDDVILVDSEDKLVQQTGRDLFLVREETIYTLPAPWDTASVARDTLLTLARGLGKQVIQSALTRDDLDSADEIFMGSTRAEVVPIVALDSELVGDGRPGQVTRALRASYIDAVRGRSQWSRSWLEYVMMEPLY